MIETAMLVLGVAESLCCVMAKCTCTIGYDCGSLCCAMAACTCTNVYDCGSLCCAMATCTCTNVYDCKQRGDFRFVYV